MPKTPHTFMGSEGKIRLPDVDEVLDIGHALHASSDRSLRGTLDQKLCQQIVADFIALKATPNTAEEPYLAAVKSIARSYGRALTRRKSEYLRELKDAKEELDRKQAQQRDSKIHSQGFGVLWRFVGPLILALSGYLFAQVVGDVIPERVSDTAGSNIPSLIMTLLFLFVGRMIGTWLGERKRDQIARAYNSRCYLAFKEYELGKLREFKLWRQRLIEEWKQYTGETYPRRVSYQLIMQGDILARQKVEEHQLLHNRNDLERLAVVFRALLGAIVRRLRPSRHHKEKQ